MENEGDIIIRDMDEEDAQRLQEKLRDFGSTSALYNSYREEVRSKVSDYIIALYKGELAGFAKLNWESSYEDFAEKQIPEIKDLWVFKAFRNKGIARLMMSYLENKAFRKSEVCAVGVGLSEEFEVAQGLFEALGYMPDGKGTFYIDSEIIHDTLEVDDTQALMMIKKIS